jgi:hypothetical protein
MLQVGNYDPGTGDSSESLGHVGVGTDAIYFNTEPFIVLSQVSTKQQQF